MKTRIVLTLVVSALAGCGGGSDENTILAAFYPLAFAAQRIGGEGVDVRNLTPPGVEPHDLELSGKDVRAIASASKRLGFSVEAHEVVLRGECGDCRTG